MGSRGTPSMLGRSSSSHDDFLLFSSCGVVSFYHFVGLFSDRYVKMVFSFTVFCLSVREKKKGSMVIIL